MPSLIIVEPIPDPCSTLLVCFAFDVVVYLKSTKVLNIWTIYSTSPPGPLFRVYTLGTLGRYYKTGQSNNSAHKCVCDIGHYKYNQCSALILTADDFAKFQEEISITYWLKDDNTVRLALLSAALWSFSSSKGDIEMKGRALFSYKVTYCKLLNYNWVRISNFSWIFQTQL